MSDDTPTTSGSSGVQCRRPTFLMIMVAQERYPTAYENEELRAWRRSCIKAQQILRSRGTELRNHYAGSTACAPSRATLYTGEYPSLHGVTQTDGGAKSAFDPDVFWLDPHTVPTIGDYLRAAGYDTYWQGKWHASHADIIVPGTNDPFLTYEMKTGLPIPGNEQLYVNADVLKDLGFRGWIGPEPHGSNPRNSGSSAATGVSGRDVVYSERTSDLIRQLDADHPGSKGPAPKPWFIVYSFINPHDIALFGAITRLLPQFRFEVDPSVPDIPPAPTAGESLLTKALAQWSYRNVYPYALQPLADTPFYRRLYYSLQLEVEREICKVLGALMNSRFYDDTIVIFTSDHGELLGAHGGLFQKWYQAYEETIHVPMIIHNPCLFAGPEFTDILTSHVDIVPTILGIAGLDAAQIQKALYSSHTEVHPLPGRDLSLLLQGGRWFGEAGEPVYFMTDDNFTKGLNQVSVTGVPYHAVIQPNSVETVVVSLPTGRNEAEQVWKYSRYFDNPEFWTIPGRKNQFTARGPVTITFNYGCRLDAQARTAPVPDQYEMYSLALDPLEAHNLAHPAFATQDTRRVQAWLHEILKQQCEVKTLYPVSKDVPGRPFCP